MKSQAIVSVCIPTYNPDRRYLGELLSSVRQQHVDAEIIVCDDGSDNAAEIKEVVSREEGACASWNSRIGMVDNWNRAVSYSSGKYVIVPGQDDVFVDGALEMLVEHAEASKLDLSLGAEGYIDDRGAQRPRPGYGVSRARFFADEICRLDREAVLGLGLLYGNVIADPCVALMRREFVDSIGGFDRRFKHACDLEMWMRMAVRGAAIGRTPDVVAMRRIHSANATVAHIGDGLANKDRVLLHDVYGEYLGSTYTWNRAVVRLYVHAWFDRARGGNIEGLRLASLRGPVVGKLRAMIDDVGENMGVRDVYGRRWGTTVSG